MKLQKFTKFTGNFTNIVAGSALAVCLLANKSQASAIYPMAPPQITLTNGGAMPLSGGLIYITSNHKPQIAVGSTPTPGFVRLCQTGDPSTRANELKANPATMAVIPVGHIMPGESVVVNLPADLMASQAVHYESMYAKTKDTCSTFTVTGDELLAVSHGAEKDFHSNEKVLASGAFLDPAGSQGASCSGAAAAVDCLRLFTAINSAPRVRYFPGYIPSVLNFLEVKYGATETQALILPTAGAVNFTVRRL